MKVTKELINKLSDCFTNNGNARFIHYEGAEKLLNQFKKEACIDFMNWLIEEKYCLKNPVEDCVNDYLKLIK